VSDYTNKRAVFEIMSDVFNSYGNNALNFDEEETKAIKRFCAMLQSQIELLPTLSETEIIRKPFERVVERLDKQAGEFIDLSHRELSNNSIPAIKYLNKGFGVAKAIEILKEECGISE
jgi:hypothetical protein